MVEKIVEFEPQLDFGALVDGSVLEHCCVEIDLIRAVEGVLAKVRLLIVRRPLKCAASWSGKSLICAGRLSGATDNGDSRGQPGVIAVTIAEDVVRVARLEASNAR